MSFSTELCDPQGSSAEPVTLFLAGKNINQAQPLGKVNIVAVTHFMSSRMVLLVQRDSGRQGIKPSPLVLTCKDKCLTMVAWLDLSKPSSS